MRKYMFQYQWQCTLQNFWKWEGLWIYWGQILAGHHDEMLSFYSKKKIYIYCEFLHSCVFSPKAICDIATEILQWISTISFIVLCIQNTQLLYTYIYLYISHFTFTTFITCITQCSEMNIKGGSKTISFK